MLVDWPTAKFGWVPTSSTDMSSENHEPATLVRRFANSVVNGKLDFRLADLLVLPPTSELIVVQRKGGNSENLSITVRELSYLEYTQIIILLAIAINDMSLLPNNIWP